MTENKGDLISREALLKRVDEEREYLKARGQLGAEHILVHNFRDLIDNAPTVEPEEVAKLKRENASLEQEMLYCRENWKKAERSQGEWKRRDEWVGGEYIGGFYHVNCPCEDGYYSKWEYNFCPNCGAGMVKGGGIGL